VEELREAAADLLDLVATASSSAPGARSNILVPCLIGGCGTFLIRGRKLLKSEFERKKER
jgi:hypothetical protein